MIRFRQWLKVCKVALVHLIDPDPVRFVRDFANWTETAPLVTIIHRPREGGGSLLLAALATITFCESHGFRYLHQPFSFVLYKPDTYSEDRFVELWNQVVPLSSIFPSAGGGEKVVNLDRRLGILPLVVGVRNIALHSDKFRTYVVHHHPELWEKGLHEVRKQTWKAWAKRYKSHGVADTDPTLCRVHVRRNDINPTDFPDRFTSASVLLNQIRYVKDSLPHVENVVLHCSGPDQDLLDIESESLILDYSDDVFATFIKMAMAKTLVVAKSTFSICAGLLSQGAVFYPAQGTELPPSWGRLPTP